MFTHRIHPLLHGLLCVFHDDLALVAIERHVGKIFTMYIEQCLLISMVVWWAYKLPTKAASCDRLEVPFGSLNLGNFFIVIFTDEI